MNNRRVFVVQVPARRSREARGNWEEKYDLTPAEEFGKLVRCLDYGNVPEDPEPTRNKLREALATFDADLDYVLLLGDPVACAQAVHVLGFDLNVQSFDALKWDRRESKYIPYQIG